EQMPLSEVVANEPQGEITSAQSSVQIRDLDVDDDWLEVRLVHPMLGEVKKHSNYARMFVSPVERNILLEAVVQHFCRGKTLQQLRSDAFNVPSKKLKTSAAFELHVSWILGMFGLSTVVLGDYEHILASDTKLQRASIDILAANQRSRLLLLVSCTLNPPK